LAELAAAGIRCTVDEEARVSGLLMLHLTTVTADGEELRLIARFSDIYPYTRFEIRAPDLDLPRHQVPFTKQLCLIGRATVNWNTEDTLAKFVRERVPLVLTTALSEDPAEVEGLEEHQGEPFSDYYASYKDSMVLVDGAWIIDPAIAGGQLLLGVEDNVRDAFRGAVLQVTDNEGNILARAHDRIVSLYKKQIKARWVRTPEPVRATGEDFLKALYAQNPLLEKVIWQSVGFTHYDIIGVIFREEQRWREYSDGWEFAVRTMPLGGTGGRGYYYHPARAGRAGLSDLAERVPELSFLRDKTVAVIGVGGIGAPSVLEFARSGVGDLRIIDGDFVDPSTVVRWPLGLSVAGRDKTESLKAFIDSNYPYTRVTARSHRVGIPRETPNEPSELQVLGELLDGVSLVYDASAEFGLNHFFSDFAAVRGVPYVCVSTTAGAWGGRVIRILPNRETAGCWVCHQHWLNEGKIPVPPEDPKGGVQPRGCADPTFTGAGFDVASVALGGVRTAISALAAGNEGAYPTVDWDVAIIRFRDERGQVLPPSWETYGLLRHPKCPNETAHSSRKGVDTGNRHKVDDDRS
jgi:molybdopterin/thiamine biosynthesis adenylyltransferase